MIRLVSLYLSVSSRKLLCENMNLLMVLLFSFFYLKQSVIVSENDEVKLTGLLKKI